MGLDLIYGPFFSLGNVLYSMCWAMSYFEIENSLPKKGYGSRARMSKRKKDKF